MTAQLLPIDLVAPGFRGVNYEQSNSLLDPAWAALAHNATIDDSGRIASRRGYSAVTTVPVSPAVNIESLHEYIQEDGTKEMILAYDGGISNSMDDPEGSDISGSVTDTDGNWWFQNFNGKVLGFQNGLKPIVRTSGNFATVTEASGTAPTVADGVALCAYGRVWALDSNRQTIKYSALLDETHWLTGAGSIDMSNVWTNGTDQVTAIAAFNGYFIVFGRHHIVVWEDTTGSQLGIDPANLKVIDVIPGTGCESQWSLQAIGEADLFYLSRHGLQSLARVIQEKSMPVSVLSHAVSGQLLADLKNTSDRSQIRSAVDLTNGLYLLSFPSVGRTWAVHFNRPFSAADFRHTTAKAEQAVLFPITTWSLAPTAWCWRTANRTLLLGASAIVGLYAGADQDNGTSFQFDYESPFIAVNQELASRLKILKRIGSILFVYNATSVTYRWAFDFRTTFNTKTHGFTSSVGSEWGEAEWGEDEWAGAVSLRIFKFPAYGKGQYIKIGIRASIVSQLAIQQLELFTKIGRLAS
jgi:hypothetical protein